jgi:hypothetical protein
MRIPLRSDGKDQAHRCWEDDLSFRVLKKVVLRPCGEAQARIIDAKGQALTGITVALEMVVTPGPHHIDREARMRGELLSDAPLLEMIDSKNYWPRPKTDSRITIFENQTKPKVLREFSVKPGETINLGEITIPEGGQSYRIG